MPLVAALQPKKKNIEIPAQTRPAAINKTPVRPFLFKTKTTPDAIPPIAPPIIAAKDAQSEIITAHKQT